jgi:serine/threonine-protein kinase RsbW
MALKNELTVAGNFENLARISDFIEQAAAGAGLDERSIYAMQMAVDEACTNIIELAPPKGTACKW